MWGIWFIIGILIGMTLTICYLITCSDDKLEEFIFKIKNIRNKK